MRELTFAFDGKEWQAVSSCAKLESMDGSEFWVTIEGDTLYVAYPSTLAAINIDGVTSGDPLAEIDLDELLNLVVSRKAKAIKMHWTQKDFLWLSRSEDLEGLEVGCQVFALGEVRRLLLKLNQG